MAVASRAELLRRLVESADRLRTVAEAAQRRDLIRSGGEESLSPTPELPRGPETGLLGQPPGSGST